MSVIEPAGGTIEGNEDVTDNANEVSLAHAYEDVGMNQPPLLQQTMMM